MTRRRRRLAPSARAAARQHPDCPAAGQARPGCRLRVGPECAPGGQLKRAGPGPLALPGRRLRVGHGSRGYRRSQGHRSSHKFKSDRPSLRAGPTAGSGSRPGVTSRGGRGPGLKKYYSRRQTPARVTLSGSRVRVHDSGWHGLITGKVKIQEEISNRWRYAVINL